ncbi:hypothetical protein [Ornithinimicrobium tianjinense]|uniref:Uncharacterized protein n=1 Tax=Ornithinimicrobium tianjinense TaxID=1195761 RepID=A0A917BNR5_9MICO|nr:hypothetical protein [Ornithinimicrobium tianjinense]GGF51135.1 hypothetical protein GCM10011366_18700 [Ornithinimicrobium tianjinense]
MEGERRARLRRRYLSLGIGELVAASVFTAVGMAQLAPRLPGTAGAVALWSALGPLVLVLVQAGVYWLLARSWVGLVGRTMPAGAATAYRAFQLANPLLLAAGLVGLVLARPGSAVLSVLLGGVWLFGVVEHVNYYVARLAWPVGRWWSGVRRWATPRLVLDLREARGSLR